MEIEMYIRRRSFRVLSSKNEIQAVPVVINFALKKTS